MHCAVRSERLLVAAVALAILVIGPGSTLRAGQKQRGKGRGGEVRCLGIRVTSPQAREGRRTRKFSATEILDLKIEVGLPAEIESDEQVTVKIFTPDGHLYQELLLTTVDDQATETSATARPRRAHGGSSKGPTKASSRVSALFPVAGTSIVTSSLYGQWTATALIGGTEASCARPTSFVITQ